MSTYKKYKWRTIRRDTVIWIMGIGLTLNEFLIEPRIRSEALVFCGLMLGLPGILAANDFAKRVVAAV
jgi:hypothetical protein